MTFLKGFDLNVISLAGADWFRVLNQCNSFWISHSVFSFFSIFQPRVHLARCCCANFPFLSYAVVVCSGHGCVNIIYINICPSLKGSICVADPDPVLTSFGLQREKQQKKTTVPVLCEHLHWPKWITITQTQWCTQPRKHKYPVGAPLVAIIYCFAEASACLLAQALLFRSPARVFGRCLAAC